MAKNEARVYIKAPMRPTCLNDKRFNAMFAEKPETKILKYNSITH